LGQWLENTVGRGDAFRSLGDDGVKFVIAGVILGLEEIHRRGFVFRDLKAENILIGKDGYPMLCDFHLMGK
jgi:serine/threonine protein kinase